MEAAAWSLEGVELRLSSPNRKVMTTLRIILRLAALLLLFAPLAALRAGDDGAIVGAIRWDGWYRDGAVTKAVEASRGQPKYHFRLPWFGQLQSDRSVRISGDSQATMEQELAYAAAARLNYWAIVDYWDEAPAMSIALNRYLAAKDERGIASTGVK